MSGDEEDDDPLRITNINLDKAFQKPDITNPGVGVVNDWMKSG